MSSNFLLAGWLAFKVIDHKAYSYESAAKVWRMANGKWGMEDVECQAGRRRRFHFISIKSCPSACQQEAGTNQRCWPLESLCIMSRKWPQDTNRNTAPGTFSRAHNKDTRTRLQEYSTQIKNEV